MAFFYIFLLVMLLYFVVLTLWFPICLIEKPDRIEIINLLNKRFRKDVIWHSDVLQVDHYTQLKWGREARYIRFLVKDGSYQLYDDNYFGTRSMIERWKGSAVKAELPPESHFTPNGTTFEIRADYWKMPRTYLLMLCIALCIPSAWLIYAYPDRGFTYLTLGFLLTCIYGILTSLRSFRIEGDELLTWTLWGQSRSVALNEVRWVNLTRKCLSIDMKDGSTITLNCRLSANQVTMFKQQFIDMGIACLDVKH